MNVIFCSNISALAAILFCVLIHDSYLSPTNFCQGLPAGQYCSNDLQGYHDCQEGSTSSSGTLKTCKGRKRCSCQFQRKCTVPISEICQRSIEPLPFARNYLVSAFGEETRKSVKGILTTRTIHTSIFKNSDSDKIRRENWIGTSGDPKTYSFEYLIRNSNGDGKYTRVCVFKYLHYFLFSLIVK